MTNFLNQHCSDIEVYSIDESFLVFSFYQQTEASLIQHCQKLKQDIYKSIGVPVSIGIGLTKTLCKLANHIAKKYTDDGVYFLHPNDAILEKIGIGKIWGVGSAYKRRLGKIKTYLPAILTLQKKRGKNLSFFPLLIYSCSSTCIKKGSEKLAAELNIQEINSEEAAEELKYFRSRSSRHFQKISSLLYYNCGADLPT